MAANFDEMANEMSKLRTRSTDPDPSTALAPRVRKHKSHTSKQVIDSRRTPTEPPRAPNMGAYRFTSLLQKMQRWKSHVTAAVVELEKAIPLPPSASDPEWCQDTLDACWQTGKNALEEMVKSSASVISIIQHSAELSGAVDFPAVEKKLIRMLKQVKPLVTAIRTVACLDDTPGLGKSLMRRTKTICRNITGFMNALETSTSDLKGTVSRATSAATELDDSCKLVLKHAYGGVEMARQNQLDQQKRHQKARDYERSAAHAKKKKEHERTRKKKLQEIDIKRQELKLQSQEAKKMLEQAKAVCRRDQINMKEALEKVRKQAERDFLMEATAASSELRRLLLGDPDFDPTTHGFAPSEESIYEATTTRKGFSTDGREMSIQEEAIDKKKNAYIARLRRAQEEATEMYEFELSQEGIYETSGSRAGFETDANVFETLVPSEKQVTSGQKQQQQQQQQPPLLQKPQVGATARSQPGNEEEDLSDDSLDDSDSDDDDDDDDDDDVDPFDDQPFASDDSDDV